MSSKARRTEFTTSLLAGSIAGTSVDLVLFPIDTLKTRLQSADGFWKSGGFRGVYRGISAAAAGSAPGAALFFGTYTLAQGELRQLSPSTPDPIIHMTAASMGEVAACIVRVPTEIVKQRMQAGRYASASVAVRDIVATSGARGLFRGYMSTLAREIPFALIQFPLYEHLKLRYSAAVERPPKPWESALAGSVAGAIAAAITTPLDVAKTRIMLSNEPSVRARAALPLPGPARGGGGRARPHARRGPPLAPNLPPQMNAVTMLRTIHREEGVGRLFSGLVPRVFWISVGGFVFFGSFEGAKGLLTKALFAE